MSNNKLTAEEEEAMRLAVEKVGKRLPYMLVGLFLFGFLVILAQAIWMR